MRLATVVYLVFVSLYSARKSLINFNPIMFANYYNDGYERRLLLSADLNLEYHNGICDATFAGVRFGRNPARTSFLGIPCYDPVTVPNAPEYRVICMAQGMLFSVEVANENFKQLRLGIMSFSCFNYFAEAFNLWQRHSIYVDNGYHLIALSQLNIV